MRHEVLFLLTLCTIAFVAALHDRHGHHRGRRRHRAVTADVSKTYTPGHQYLYNFDSQLYTHINGTKTTAVTRTRAVLVLAFTEKTKVLAEVRQIRMFAGHADTVNNHELFNTNLLDAVSIPSTNLAALSTAFQFKFDGGEITEIYFDESDVEYSMNIKRGLLNVLQVSYSRALDGNAILDGPITNVVKEDAPEGRCEAHYRVQDGESGEIITQKSINFGWCTSISDIRYNYRFGSQCAVNSQYDRNLRRKTTARHGIAGKHDGAIVTHCRLNSEYSFTAFVHENSIITKVLAMLTFQSSSEEKTVVAPTRFQPGAPESLVYNKNREINLESFWLKGDQSFPTELVKRVGKINAAVEMITKLHEAIKNGEKEGLETAAGHFSHLVDILRMCKTTHLTAILATVEPDLIKSKITAEVIYQALGVAGTHSSITVLTGKLKTADSNAPLMTLFGILNARAAEEQTILDLEVHCNALMKKDRDSLASVACWCVVGALINQVCSQNEDRRANERVVQQSLRDKMKNLLWKHYTSANSQGQRIHALEAVGNSGLKEFSTDLKALVKDSQVERSVKLAAVGSFRNMAKYWDETVDELLELFIVETLDQSVRMATLIQLFMCYPAESKMEQIADAVDKTTGKKLKSFAYSLLQSYASSTNPCEAQFAKTAKKYLNDLRFQAESKTTSTSGRYSKHWPYHASGFDLHFHTIYDSADLLPREASFGIDGTVIGLIQRNIFEITISQGSLEKTLMPLFAKVSTGSNSDALAFVLKKRWEDFEYGKSSENGYGSLSLRYRDIDIGSIYVDAVTLPNWLIQLFVGVVRYEDDFFLKLAKGLDYDAKYATFLYESSRQVPTSLGIPLVISGRLPSTTVIKTHVNATFVQDSEDVTTAMSGSLNAQVQSASTHILEASAFLPFMKTGITQIQTIEVHVPFSIRSGLDLPQKNFNISMPVPQEKLRLAYGKVETKAVIQFAPLDLVSSFTTSRDITTDVILDGMPLNAVQKPVGKEFVGLKFFTVSRWHKTAFEAPPNYPLPVLAAKMFYELYFEPGTDAPKELVATIITTPQSDISYTFKRPNWQARDRLAAVYGTGNPINENADVSNVTIILEATGTKRKNRISIQSVSGCATYSEFCKFEVKLETGSINSDGKEEILKATGVLHKRREPGKYRQLGVLEVFSFNKDEEKTATRVNKFTFEDQFATQRRTRRRSRRRHRGSRSADASDEVVYKLLIDTRTNMPSDPLETKVTYAGAVVDFISKYQDVKACINTADPSMEPKADFSFTGEDLNLIYRNTSGCFESSTHLKQIFDEVIQMAFSYVQSPSQCTITSNSIRTFDGLTLAFPSIDCDTMVLFMYQQDREGFFVTMKPVSLQIDDDSTPIQTIKVTLGLPKYNLSITTKDDGVNGLHPILHVDKIAPVSSCKLCRDQQTIVDVRKYKEYNLDVQTHEHRTVFNNEYITMIMNTTTVIIELKPILSTFSHGLCGSPNGNQHDDYDFELKRAKALPKECHDQSIDLNHFYCAFRQFQLDPTCTLNSDKKAYAVVEEDERTKPILRYFGLRIVSNAVCVTTKKYRKCPFGTESIHSEKLTASARCFACNTDVANDVLKTIHEDKELPKDALKGGVFYEWITEEVACRTTDNFEFVPNMFC